MRKLVFFFPWPEVSGGPIFLTHLANEVARKGLYEVYYTDYSHGLCEALLEEESIQVLKYDNEGENFEIFPDEPVVLVMAEYWAHMVPKVHPDTKIVFFNWHNECLMVLQRDWCTTDRFLNKFLELVYETSSVFFCDKTHWLAHNRFGLTFPETYVPIVLPQRKAVAKPDVINAKERNVAILGRLCLDKIYAILDLLDNFVRLRDTVRTNVYVIGEGDCQNMLWERKFPKHIKLIRCKTMEIQDALALMEQKVDILFAMGTSVLEGATIRLPAVVIPNAIKPFECNRYPYLYESTGYALGWYPEQIDDLGIQAHTLKEIIRDIYVDHKKEEIGNRCYEYYLKNHQTNLAQFLSAINASTLSANDYYTFKKKTVNWKRYAWLVRNAFAKLRGAPIKRFCLFGFPLFTVAKTNTYFINVFVCCIPLLRINHIGNSYSFHILPLVWVYRTAQLVLKLLRRKYGKEEEDKK